MRDATHQVSITQKIDLDTCNSSLWILVNSIMKNILFLSIIVTLICFSCNTVDDLLDENVLQEYLTLNDSLAIGDLVACAGGREIGLIGNASEPTDVFFYPIKDAFDFRYFEAKEIADSLDYSKYIAKDLDDEPLFNGYLWKFNNTPFTGERMGIVTYKTPGNIHVCTPVRLKTYVKPTELNHEIITVEPNGVNPSFAWEDGLIEENVIYFQIVSDLDGNLISGTYTTDKTWTFYDESNVVFNITDTLTTPTLEPNEMYKFSLMAVSEDNWVNLFGEVDFVTE